LTWVLRDDEKAKTRDLTATWWGFFYL